MPNNAKTMLNNIETYEQQKQQTSAIMKRKKTRVWQCLLHDSSTSIRKPDVEHLHISSRRIFKLNHFGEALYFPNLEFVGIVLHLFVKHVVHFVWIISGLNRAIIICSANYLHFVQSMACSVNCLHLLLLLYHTN